MTLPPESPAAEAGVSRRATLALVAVCAVWGATFTTVKDALNDSSSLLFLALRFGVASVSLWAAFRWRGPIRVSRDLLWNGGLLGTALFGGYLFQTVGLRFTTPARSAFLTGLFIVFVPGLLALLRRRWPPLEESLGIAVALLGMMFLASPLSLAGASFGDLLTVVCAVSYAAHILLLSRLSAGRDLRALTLIQIAVGFLLAGATFWWVEQPVLIPSPRLWIAVGFTGVAATAVAFLVQTWAQRHVPPTRTAFIFALEPVFAWITSYFLTGERLSTSGVAGAGLILLGILFVETKPFARFAIRRRKSGDRVA